MSARSFRVRGYSGRHEGVKTVAQWASIGDRWVGTWQDDGNDLYLFTFELPK